MLWLTGPFYDCSGIGFHLFRLSVSVAKTCTFPVHSFQGIHLYLGQVYGCFAIVSSVLKPKKEFQDGDCLPACQLETHLYHLLIALRDYENMTAPLRK